FSGSLRNSVLAVAESRAPWVRWDRCLSTLSPKEAPVMVSIPVEPALFNVGDPAVLDSLLGLPDLTITPLELAAWRGWLLLHCTPVAEEADCPTCARPSHTIHQYHQRTVRDLPWADYQCYLQVTRRRFDCAHCGVPFTEPLAAVAPRARTTRRYAA